MKRPTAYVLIAGLVMLMACKEDDGWTSQRREWLRKRCTRDLPEREQVCDCVVREVTTTVSFKELVTGEPSFPINGLSHGEYVALSVCTAAP
jgi:hypothetical protein